MDLNIVNAISAVKGLVFFILVITIGDMVESQRGYEHHVTPATKKICSNECKKWFPKLTWDGYDKRKVWKMICENSEIKCCPGYEGLNCETEITSSSKEGDPPSPDDPSLAKKRKLARQSSVERDSSIASDKMTSPTLIVLEDAAIESIALALKDSLQTELNTMLKSTVESVIKRLIDGLQHEINSLKTENEALRSENSEQFPGISA